MSKLVLGGVNVFDPASKKRQTNVNVCMADGKIAAIGDVPPFFSDARRLELTGRTILPGFIDLHVHVVAANTNLGLSAAMPNFLAALKTLPVLRGMLNRGFTTVRDAGGADFGMCEAVNSGVLWGPRILSSGKALSQTGGHGDFRQRNDKLDDACGCLGRQGSIARVVDGVDAMRLDVLAGKYAPLKRIGAGNHACSRPDGVPVRRLMWWLRWLMGVAAFACATCRS